MKRGYRNFVKIYRKKLENVFKIGLKYTVGTVCYIIIDRERIRAEDSGDLFLYFQWGREPVGECRASGATDSTEDEGCAGTAAWQWNIKVPWDIKKSVYKINCTIYVNCSKNSKQNTHLNYIRCKRHLNKNTEKSL